jgi:S-adenosyl methyltransferase
MASSSPKPQVDTSKPHPARVYDFLLGGKDNYRVDRELGSKMPDFLRYAAEQNRGFMRRAVAWAAGEGIDQFLDIGTGIPTEPNLHQVVQRIVPSARVVYTDNDPIVLRHAEALLQSTPEGLTDYIEADIRQPSVIVEHAREILDFDRPVMLSLVAIMHFIMDEEKPYDIVRTLIGALPQGSMLALAHGTTDGFEDEEVMYRTYSSSIPSRWRTLDEIMPFFEGLDLVEPGVVRAPEWRKPADAPESKPYPGYVAVARVR